MRATSFFYVLSWNLKTILRKRHLLLTVLGFGLIGVSSVCYVLLYPSPLKRNIWDAVLVAFAGPGIWGNSILDMLRWFVPNVLFLYLFGNIAAGEFDRGGVFIIPLIGSRKMWWLGKIATLLILSIGYMALGLVIVVICSMVFLPWSSELSPFLLSETFLQRQGDFQIEILLGWITILFTSTLFAISSLQAALSIFWKKSFVAFLAVIAVLIMSWLAGNDHPAIAPWLPGSQSMLLRHTYFDPSVPNFSLAWSLIYNVVLTSIVSAVSLWCIRRLDIWKDPSDSHMEERQ